MAEKVVVVDFGSGNLRSVQKALERAARESGLGAEIMVADDPDLVAGADRIVLPGVGAFASSMTGLAAVDGLLPALEHAALTAKRPFLGICVGMQILAERGLEFGDTPGLGWIPGVIRPIEASDAMIRVPHMGWNTVRARAPHPVLASMDHQPTDFYFAHSFHFDAENDSHLMGVTDCGGRIAAIVGRDNLIALQFHPEKSQAAGLALLADFLSWRP